MIEYLLKEVFMNIMFRKGNLYNELEGRIDNRLIDSSQFDLEVSTPDKVAFYRLRNMTSAAVAEGIIPESFTSPKFSKQGIRVSEMQEFMGTSFFEEEFPYQREFKKSLLEEHIDVQSYYAFLQRVTGKKIINNRADLYSFSLPALGNREKEGISSYHVDIETFRNRYYAVFFSEQVNGRDIQKVNHEYMIYDKHAFTRARAALDNQVLDIAIEKGYPLNFLRYVYLMTGGDISLINAFFEGLQRCDNLQELCSLDLSAVLGPDIHSPELEGELSRFLSGEQDDIDFSYNIRKREIK